MNQAGKQGTTTMSSINNRLNCCAQCSVQGRTRKGREEHTHSKLFQSKRISQHERSGEIEIIYLLYELCKLFISFIYSGLKHTDKSPNPLFINRRKHYYFIWRALKTEALTFFRGENNCAVYIPFRLRE